MNKRRKTKETEHLEPINGDQAILLTEASALRIITVIDNIDHSGELPEDNPVLTNIADETKDGVRIIGVPGHTYATVGCTPGQALVNAWLKIGNVIMSCYGIGIVAGIVIMIMMCPSHDIIAGINLWFAILEVIWLGALGMLISGWKHVAISNQLNLLKFVLGITVYAVLIGNVVTCFRQNKCSTSEKIKQLTLVVISTLLLIPCPSMGTERYHTAPRSAHDFEGLVIGMILALPCGALFSLMLSASVKEDPAQHWFMSFTLFVLFSMMLTIPVTVVIRMQGKMRKSTQGKERDRSTSGVAPAEGREEFVREVIQKLYQTGDPSVLKNNWLPDARARFTTECELQIRKALENRKASMGSYSRLRELAPCPLGHGPSLPIAQVWSKVMAKLTIWTGKYVVEDYIAGLDFETGFINMSLRLIYDIPEKRWYFGDWQVTSSMESRNKKST